MDALRELSLEDNFKTLNILGMFPESRLSCQPGHMILKSKLSRAWMDCSIYGYQD